MTTIASALQAPGLGAMAPARAADPRLAKVAQEMESIFTQMLMKSMRSTVQKNEYFNGGRGEEIFQGMLDETMSQTASKDGRGLGIAKMIVDRLSRYTQPAEETKGKNFDLREGS